ncbi:Fc.00g067370.m01.CDS01 [Cosmosporella sp. VM-42]
MHIDVLPRQRNPDCPPGKSFYFCGANKFRGCCSRDPCDLPSGCPILLETPSSETSQTFTFTDLESFPTIFDELTTRTIGSGEPSPLLEASTQPKQKTRTTSTMFETQPSEDETELETSTSTSTLKSRTLTDSGTTRTIPNNSKVTVTRKTVIVTDKAPTEPTAPSLVSSTETTPTTLVTSTVAPSPVQTTIAEVGKSNGLLLSTGAIVGAAVGGAVVLGIFVVLLMKCLRRRKELNRSHSNATSMGGVGRYGVGEKEGMSAQHTGESDPFAEFGGRVDKPEDPYAPKLNTFEMDATSTAPVELPAEPVGSHPTPRVEPAPVPVAGPSDPRANLNASLSDRSQHTYVNHWNQYRSLSQDH